MIKILIVDDIKILCQGLEAILKQDKELCVLGSAQNGKQAVELCEKLRPDVVLMDMNMPEYDGGYAARQIKQLGYEVKILVLTTFDDEETVQKAISSGVDGYILKEMDEIKIIQSIKSVYAGIVVLGSSIFERMKEKRKTLPSYETGQNITEREKELLAYVMRGYNNKEIAGKMNLAEGTVRNNISKLLEKLKLKDRTQLAVFGIKNGIE